MVCLQEQLLCFNQQGSEKAGMRRWIKMGKEMRPAEAGADDRGDIGGKASQATHELSALGP